MNRAAAPRALAEGDTIRRNTALSIVAQIVPALLTLALTVYLVRALGPDSYGQFALAMAIGLLFLLPSDFGLTQSAARFVADHRADAGAVAAVLSDALRLKLIGGLVISVALLALARPIAEAYDEPHLVWPLRGVALAVFAQGMMVFFNTAFVALRRVYLSLRVVLTESAAEVGASVVLVALGAGAAGAAFGRALGFGFGAVVALVLTYRLIGPSAVAVLGSGSGHVRQIARYAGAMLIIEGAYSALASVDALVIGAVLGATQVGLFHAPFRLVYALTYVGLAFANGVAPRMSRTGAGPDVGAFMTATRYLLMLQAVLAIPVAVWAEPISKLVFGDKYDASIEVLRALAVFVFVAGFAPLFAVSVNYFGEARRRIPIVLGAVLVNLVADLALIPAIGVMGAAIGTNLGIIVYTGAHLWMCERMIRLPLRALAKTLARSLLAGVVMAAFLVVLGTSNVSIPVLIVGGLCSVAVFAVVIIALGEFSRAELAGVWGRIRRVR